MQRCVGFFGGFENKKEREEKEEEKRDSSAAQADSFARAKEKKKRRPASVGMTVGGGVAETHRGTISADRD